MLGSSVCTVKVITCHEEYIDIKLKYIISMCFLCWSLVDRNAIKIQFKAYYFKLVVVVLSVNCLTMVFSGAGLLKIDFLVNLGFKNSRHQNLTYSMLNILFFPGLCCFICE